MHAAWTLLLARAPDTDAATAAALAIAVVVFAPFAALSWDVEAAALPYIALSAVFEIGFFAMLALALRSGEVGLVYPLSRGVAPVLVLLVGVVALGTHVSAAQAAGVGVIAAGVLLARGLDGRANARDTGYALACGACIAGYTLTDSYGLDHAAPVPYLECVLIPVVLVYVPAVARLRGRRPPGRDAPHRHRGAVHLRRLRAGAGRARARAGRAGGGAAGDERGVRHRVRRALPRRARRRAADRGRGRRGGGDHGAGAGVMPTELSPRRSSRTASAPAASMPITPNETCSESTPSSVQ